MFISTVAGSSRCVVNMRTMPATSAAIFTASNHTYGLEVAQSRYSCSIRPPFAVTLNLPFLGLMKAMVVGSTVYHASTDS